MTQSLEKNRAKTTKTKTKVVITLDLGGSKTKTVVSVYPDGDPVVVVMEPEIADVSKESLANLQADGVPENRCWVGIEGEYYALGLLGRTAFGGLSMLRDLKYTLAVPKICGILWVVKEKLKLDGSLEAYVAVLLPPGEVADSQALGLKLKEALKGFDTPTGVMKVKLLNFAAHPEGNGVLIHRIFSLGEEEYSSKTLALVMVGFRNASAFVSVNGVITTGVSSEFGMSWMVNKFVSKCSGLSKDDSKVVQAIVLAGVECNSASFTKLSRKRKPEEIADDAEVMSAAAKLSRDEYARALSRWIRSTIPANTHEIVLCGGTAEYVRAELNAYFEKEGIAVVWNGSVEVPSTVDTSGMGSRLADVWAQHETFIELVDELTGYSRQASPKVAPALVTPVSASTGATLTDSSTTTSGYVSLYKNIRVADPDRPSSSNTPYVEPKGVLKPRDKQ